MFFSAGAWFFFAAPDLVVFAVLADEEVLDFEEADDVLPFDSVVFAALLLDFDSPLAAVDLPAAFDPVDLVFDFVDVVAVGMCLNLPMLFSNYSALGQAVCRF